MLRGGWLMVWIHVIKFFSLGVCFDSYLFDVWITLMVPILGKGQNEPGTKLMRECLERIHIQSHDVLLLLSLEYNFSIGNTFKMH